MLEQMLVDCLEILKNINVLMEKESISKEEAEQIAEQLTAIDELLEAISKEKERFIIKLQERNNLKLL